MCSMNLCRFWYPIINSKGLINCVIFTIHKLSKSITRWFQSFNCNIHVAELQLRPFYFIFSLNDLYGLSLSIAFSLYNDYADDWSGCCLLYANVVRYRYCLERCLLWQDRRHIIVIRIQRMQVILFQCILSVFQLFIIIV